LKLFAAESIEPSPPTTKIRSKLFSSLSLLPGKKVSKLTSFFERMVCIFVSASFDLFIS